MYLAIGNEWVKPRAIPHKTTFGTTSIVGVDQRLRSTIPANTIVRVEGHRDGMSAVVFPVNHLCSHDPVFALHHQQIVHSHMLKWDSAPSASSILGEDQALIVKLRRPSLEQHSCGVPDRCDFQHE